jgi:hypothetical protein
MPKKSCVSTGGGSDWDERASLRHHPAFPCKNNKNAEFYLVPVFLSVGKWMAMAQRPTPDDGAICLDFVVNPLRLSHPGLTYYPKAILHVEAQFLVSSRGGGAS